MLYKRNRRKYLNSLIFKGRLYNAIKNRSVGIFEEDYLDGYYTPLTNCIDKSIDYYWDDILESEEFERVDNEDELGEILLNEISDDLDEEDIIYNLKRPADYWGLSARQRNQGLR